MKVLVCVNKNRDTKLVFQKTLEKTLLKNKIEYDISYETNDIKSINYDALFVIGGDGTVLRYVSFSNLYNIPIIALNAGKLGFLTEFECNECSDAVSLLIANKLKKDCRSTLVVCCGNEKYYALNDAVIQRIYNDNEGMMISVDVSIDKDKVELITGDGVIVSTPTGSTAYSLSAGGSILAPGINAFCITPIAAHSFYERSVIYSADLCCKLKYVNGTSAGLFVDGKLVKVLDKNSEIFIKKADNPTIFYRKSDSEFFKKLTEKLKNRAGL